LANVKQIFSSETAWPNGFCQAVSEEKIVLNCSQSETRIALGGHICWWNRMKWRKYIEDLILFSDWLMLKKSSPLKQFGQMEPNLA
jgi:hypothetical protein